MLIIKKLNTTLLLLTIAFLMFLSCSSKAPHEKVNSEAVEVDSATEFYEQPETKTVYDYRSFQGIYDHESTTRGFAAILTITESGDDLAFTLSVSQGTCKGKAEGKIIMVSHEQNFHVGFYEPDQCPLQFSLLLSEAKIDVKEVNLCKLHDSNCSFEGTYIKRKIN